MNNEHSQKERDRERNAQETLIMMGGLSLHVSIPLTMACKILLFWVKTQPLKPLNTVEQGSLLMLRGRVRVTFAGSGKLPKLVNFLIVVQLIIRLTRAKNELYNNQEIAKLG